MREFRPSEKMKLCQKLVIKNLEIERNAQFPFLEIVCIEILMIIKKGKKVVPLFEMKKCFQDLLDTDLNWLFVRS